MWQAMERYLGYLRELHKEAAIHRGSDIDYHRNSVTFIDNFIRQMETLQAQHVEESSGRKSDEGSPYMETTREED
jgi:hypothetical protein